MMDKFKKLQDELWSYAETGMVEYKSCEAMTKFLEDEGFDVEKGIANMPTAYVASYGHGKPVIAFLAEYDALFGMNQMADVCEYHPITNSEDTGHGCGHHQDRRFGGIGTASGLGGWHCRPGGNGQHAA